MKKNKGLIKPTLQITFFSIISIFIGFVSQMIIAYYFGTKFERDAYFVAIIIPTYITSIFIGSFGVVFLPKVVEILSKKNQQSLSEFISSTFLLLITILLFITSGCFLFSNEIISFFAPSYNDYQIAYTEKILIIVMPSIIFSVISNMLASLYQIKNRFVRPALVTIISSMVSVLFVIIFSNKIGILGLAYGFLTGSFITFLLLSPIIRTYNLELNFNFKHVDILLFLKTVTPLLLSGLLFRSTGVIERILASTLSEGSVSYLGYSNQIFTALLTITASGIAITSYPTLSRLWSEKKTNEIEDFFTKTVSISLLISIPIVISIIVFGDLCIKALFERGEFTSSNTINVGKALSWLMGAFIFQSLGSIVMKIFFLAGKTITVSIIAVFELLIYFLLSFLLSKYYGFIGLAIASSVSSFVFVFLALFVINRTLINLKFFPIFLQILKIIVASTISILVVYSLYYNIIGVDSILYLIISYFFGLSTFLFVGIYIKINEMALIQEKIIKLKQRFI
jgi:putative peptidoglycan lipid II flippase